MKKICVLTTTRADYGLYYWLLKKLNVSEGLKLQLVVSGTHLEEDYGYTVKEIREASFEITKELKIFDSQDKSERSVAQAMSRMQWEFFLALEELNPDFVMLLGDRYEMAAAALATTAARKPIIHLYGGEITRGAVDDSLRHAITKLSYFHFTANDQYTQRVVQMGESPERVFTVGALGLDHITHSSLPLKPHMEDHVGLSFDKPTALVTYHPSTLTNMSPEKQISNFLAALDDFPDLQVILTMPNADWGRWDIVKQIEAWQDRNKIRSRVFQSMGQLRYLAAMKYAWCILGNSSSGIIEAPSFGTPTLNIGDRQAGRIQASSTLNCGPGHGQIVDGIKSILEFKNKNRGLKIINPYGDGHAARKIIEILQGLKVPLTLAKEFYEKLA